MSERIETLQQFFHLLSGTREVRAGIVERLLSAPEAAGGPASAPAAHVPSADVEALRQVLEALRSMPHEDGRYRLSTDSGSSVTLEPDYEIGELEKDLAFLNEAEPDFLARLAALHPGFEGERREAAELLDPVPAFRLFTDRDGTVNNYCGRYRSSVQAAWNGLFLSRFARSRAHSAVILTSAPLHPGGLLEVSVTPRELFIYAGSKGREFMDPRGGVRRYPIEAEKQERLDLLNRRLGELLEQPEYEIYGLIGSSLQLKFGQTTVARQDIHRSIAERRSERFLERVQNLVRELDPEHRFFRIEDTGTDIEIILTVEEHGGGARDFDKGDGIAFLDRELSLGLERGPNLICGDTRSDVAMVRAAMERTSETWAVFVTRDEPLRQEVAGICPRSRFVSEPDVLAAVLNDLGRRGAP